MAMKEYFLSVELGNLFKNKVLKARAYGISTRQPECTHDDLQKEGSLVCRICSVKTEDEKKLKKHFKHNHLKSLPYQCPTCKAEFDSFSAENEHRMIHVEKGNQFTCLICTAKFLTYKDLYFHYSKDHVEQSQSICTICNITFPNDMALEEHNYVKHQSYDRFKCIFCHKAFTNSVSLTVHMKGHTTKFYKCKICYRPFKEAATLFQHMLFHASSFGTEKPLKCAICLASYAKQSRLKYHISRHIAKNSFSCQCLICGETMLDDESLINHIFDHSISITENNMTEKEIEWVEGVKQRKLVVKRGRRRLSSNLDYKCKPNIKIEKDDPEYKPCIKIEKVSRENEASPPLRQGRGRPRKIKVESHETPGPKQGRGRPRKQPQNDDTTMETKPVVQTHEDIIQEKNLYRLDNTRKSSRLVEKNSSGEYNMCKEIKKEKEDKDIVKRAKLIKQNDSKCTALTTKTFTATSKISSTKVNKAEEEIYLVSTKSRSTLRRNSLKEEKPLKNNDKHFYDSNCEILGENSCLSNKESNNVNKSINKPLQNGGVGPEIITISKVSRGGNKNEAISHNNWSSPIKIPENSDTIETKVRPMSFKMFSSLTNTRTPKPLNKKLMSDKLSEGKMQDEKSNSVDQMFSSLTNTRTPKPLNKELMNGKHSEGKIQDEKSNSVDQMFSSLTNTRTPKPLNKELMNGKLSQGKMQDEKSNSVDQMFSSLTNTRTPKPLNKKLMNGKLSQGKMQDEKSNSVDQMFSSLTNTRTPKPLNKKLMNGKLSQGKMQDEKSNSVGQMFSSLTNTRTPKPLNMEITNGKLCEGKMQDEKSNFVDPDSLEFKEDMFDDAEEDPLGGIEIPYISPRKGLRCNSRVIKGILDLNGPVSTMKNEKTLSHAETNKDEGGESKNPIDFIKESKYFEPSRGLTKYSCTTCLLSFSSQEELLFHNTTHIL